jgi:serine/threonine protein kinase
LLSEAQKAANLEHSGIVQVYDWGRQDSWCFIVSQLVDGTSLAERASRERLGYEEAARILAEVAEALHYAHLQGIVHRNVKPSNILVDKVGKAHLTDFGIAATENKSREQRGAVSGTLVYMSPEQAKGESQRMTPRADIYSLGVVLYELAVSNLNRNR